MFHTSINLTFEDSEELLRLLNRFGFDLEKYASLDDNQSLIIMLNEVFLEDAQAYVVDKGLERSRLASILNDLAKKLN